MVTENGRLAEVTEAAERMGTRRFRKPKNLTTESTEFHKEKIHRGFLMFSLWFFSVFLCVLCGKDPLPEPSTQLLSHQFVYQLRIGLAF